MISLEQILLLEKKVESAVAKIAQLQAENDALRSKCSELTNALSSKSEQLSSFENDQNKIETGILKALDRLSSIENTVLRAAELSREQAALQRQAEETPSTPTPQENEPAAEQTPNASFPTDQIEEEPIEQINEQPAEHFAPVNQNPSNNYEENPEPSYNQKQFYDMEQVSSSSDDSMISDDQGYPEDEGNPESDDTDENGQFDIF